MISESRELTFDTDIADPERLREVLAGLAGRLWRALEDQGRRGRTVSIKVRLRDFSTYTRARTLPAPPESALELDAVAQDLLRRHPPAQPVRLLGVRVAGLRPAEAGGVGQLALGL